MSQFVYFARGRDNVMGPVLGPFEWVQVTYRDLRTPDREVIAQWVTEAEEWFIVYGEHSGEFYSDVIVGPKDLFESAVVDHDCAAAKTTIYGEDGEGRAVEVRWNNAIRAWEPTGRLWDYRVGAWT